jgi:hypothetical protein
VTEIIECGSTVFEFQCTPDAPGNDQRRITVRQLAGHCYGHGLLLYRQNGQAIASCKGGEWRVNLPAPPGVDLVVLVSTFTRLFDEHLATLGSPSRQGPTQLP